MYSIYIYIYVYPHLYRDKKCVVTYLIYGLYTKYTLNTVVYFGHVTWKISPATSAVGVSGSAGGCGRGHAAIRSQWMGVGDRKLKLVN